MTLTESYDYAQADELTQRVQKGHLVLAEEMAEVRRAAAVHHHDGRPRRIRPALQLRGSDARGAPDARRRRAAAAGEMTSV